MNEALPFQSPSAPLADAPLEALFLAGRGRRLGAYTMDGLLSLICCIPFLADVTIKQLHRQGLCTSYSIGMEGVMLTVLLLAGFGTLNWVWLHRYGQTIGKRIFKIRIVRSNGDRVTLTRILFIRNLPFVLVGFGCIPFLGPLFHLVEVLFIFSQKRQCLHDRLADTQVVEAS